MVEKMKYINLTGPGSEVDRAVEEYLSRYSVQLEFASKELKDGKELTGFTGHNPYPELLRKAGSFLSSFNLDDTKLLKGRQSTLPTKERAVELIETVSEHVDSRAKDLQAMISQKQQCLEAAAEYEHFADIDFNVEDLAGFEFIRYHFGRMPSAVHKQFGEFLDNAPDILFIPGKNDGETIWCVYFTTAYAYDRVESIFSSLHFSKAQLPAAACGIALSGTPREICRTMRSTAENLSGQIDKRMTEEADSDETGFSKEDIICAYKKIYALNLCFDARKYAVKTSSQFFIFVGWMTEKDAYKLKEELDNDEKLSLMIEEDNESILSKPPTKLKNRRFIRPFEFFVKMYGLPSYAEIDPTPFLALTYSLLFGVMFADVGQGAIISLLGAFLGLKRKMALGKVMMVIGCASMAAGLMFGSFFGFEFTPLLLHPAEPDNLMNILIYAVVIGVLLIVMSITFNIANAIKTRKITDVLFSPNGPAGIIFYGAIAFGAYGMVSGNGISPAAISGVIAPVVLIAAKTPLTSLIRGEKIKIHGNPFLYLFETVIELFEIVLSYFSNMISYLRVGAFAISHASIMGIVWTLSKTAAGTNSLPVLIFGNLLVVALEGLIVGIQVLRLEFYEMFSRFYEGEGRAFEPYAQPKPQDTAK